MLLPQVGEDPTGQLAVSLLTASRAASTYASYRGKARLWLEFCALHGVSPLQATAADMVKYVAHLALKGSIAASSMGPYLAAVRTIYRDLGLTPPDQGTAWVSQALDGLRAHQQDVSPPAGERHPIPAQLIYQALRVADDLLPPLPARGVSTRSSAARAAISAPDLRLARACLATAVAFIFFNRPGYNARVTARELAVDFTADGSPAALVHVPRGTKTTRLHRHADIEARAVPASSHARAHPRADGLAGVDISALVARFRAARREAQPSSQLQHLDHPDELAWRLPGENTASWGAHTQDVWLREALAHLKARPPPGFKWTGHSLRKGAASAAAAVGVSLLVIAFFGVWSPTSSTLAHHYVDPTMTACPAAWFFFGWLTPAGVPSPAGGDAGRDARGGELGTPQPNGPDIGNNG